MTLRRFEISTFGVNEALQGFSSDPFVPASPFPTGPGLRIPTVLPGDAGPDTRPRYFFQLASREISEGKTRVRGIRQGLAIGCNASAIDGLVYPVTKIVETPNWSFIDGNVSWHLVREPNTRRVFQQPTTNGPSWRYTESDTPAMLYQSFVNSAVNPSTGSPVQYNLGLTSYVPPAPGAWEPIAGLGNFKDIRFPWKGRGDISNNINEVVEGSWRISLYASILQTNPSTRLQANIPAISNIYSGALGPEEAFLATFDGGEGVPGPAIYWSVFGSILFEDEDYHVKRVRE